MKTLVRAFVVALAVTGFVASTASAHSSSAQTSTKITKTLPGDRQTPTCAPNQPGWQDCWQN